MFWTRYRSYIVIIVAAAVVAAGFLGGYFLSGFLRPEFPTPREGEVSPDGSGVKPANGGDEEVLASGAVLEFRYLYQECGHIVTEIREASTGEVGLTLDGLRERYPGGKVYSFERHGAIIEEERPGKCPNYFLGVEDGYVAVYHGFPPDRTDLVEATSIPVGHLPREEQARLSQGIVIEEPDELWRFVEGFAD